MSAVFSWFYFQRKATLKIAGSEVPNLISILMTVEGSSLCG